MEINSDKNKIAIVVVGYNKLHGLSRLLTTLNSIMYCVPNVPLIISIDASENQSVYNLAREFRWKHGELIVNIEKERLGLKKHIFQCAALSEHYRGVIILEDDILVSPDFYNYALQALDNYENDDRIAGIALYSFDTIVYSSLPFQPVLSGYDVFAWQTVCTWGQIFTWKMWSGFINWLDTWDGRFDKIDMMSFIGNWSRAWSKYYFAYIISNNKYFIFPYNSLSTNFNDAGGEHGGGNTSLVQLNLLQGKRHYQLCDLSEMTKYDVYASNEDIYNWLGLKKDDITIDFYGLHDSYETQYVLTPFNLHCEAIKGFSLSMRPWELNIKYSVEGKDIILYNRGTNKKETAIKSIDCYGVASYFLRGFNVRLLDLYYWNLFKSRIKKKIHLI